MEDLIRRVATAKDPEAALETSFDKAVDEFVREIRRFDAIRLIETARLAFLPIAPEGGMPVDPESVAAYVELLALVALAARPDTVGESAPGSESIKFQEMSGFVTRAKDELAALFRLAQLKLLTAAGPTDKLALISLLIQGAEIWIRNPSYPEMVEVTNLELLDGNETIRAALNNDLGFDATDALAVLNACHDLQIDNMNDRFEAAGAVILSAMESAPDSEPDLRQKELARAAIKSMFEPDADQSTVAAEDIVARTNIAEHRVRAVIERFRLDLTATTPAEVIDKFTTGKNPMRAQPLIVSGTGRIMLPHSALNVVAARENLEDHLKTSTVWNKYQKHRGDLLEARTRAALGRLLPGAHFRDAFEYYVPANDAEAKAADPTRYTKRVEGDHLVILDDVAIIVEDKAVALSAHSRGGKAARIRNDLTGMITKAADQALRVRDRIERDKGLRIEDEGWVDLSHVREIHTVAVSLDDLSTVLTATAALIRADLLTPDNIPWTVSLHDLELISELVERPAEFLLYLRRRRNPDVTLMFKAADELDLFLHFFEEGLWVEPDPAQVRIAFPFMPEPTTGEIRRYRGQQPVIVSSRTDPLDRWFHTKDRAEGEPAPKPAMVPSPIADLIDELQSRNVSGWLSIGATLLSGSTDAQLLFARYRDELLENPSPDGTGRTLAMPLTASVDPAEGWLLVWATRPAGEDVAVTEKRLRAYLRAKKHQLSFPRGVVFLYDEPTRDFIGADYDGHVGSLDAEHTAVLGSLRPISDFQRHPNIKRLAYGERRAPRKKAQRKRR